ncbi:MAG TPA: addiction module protein [Rhizomicrobium sp.]|jgi:putative addiction module component (TIGR02574 family)|nr:addiction module protein [Rhizomicrobium sp.]
MTRSEILDELRKLDPEERAELIEELWESVEEDDFFLTDEQAAEIERRAAELEADPSIGIPWEEIRADLRKRFG